MNLVRYSSVYTYSQGCHSHHYHLFPSKVLNWCPYPVKNLSYATQGQGCSQGGFFAFIITRTLFYHLSVMFLSILRKFPSMVLVWYMLSVCLPATAPFLQSDSHSEGPCRGTACHLFHYCLIQAYDFEGKVPPFSHQSTLL